MIRDILRGSAQRKDYALYLRNLLPVYEVLEHGLLARADEPVPATAIRLGLIRHRRIAVDLIRIYGPDWHRSLPVLPASRRYVVRAERAAKAGGPRLAAHAYVRYLGDLSGGQTLSALLARSLGLRDDELRMYQFPMVSDIAAAKAEFRNALEMTPSDGSDAQCLIREALCAFRLNISVSEGILTSPSER